MYKQTSSKIVPLTRELAEEFATMRSTPGERRLTPKRKNYLLQKFNDGAFHSPVWASATVNGIRYRANGQHSSTMLAELNGNFPVGLPVHVMEFECDGMPDLADLFGQFDAKDSARSVNDIITSHGRIHPELDKISSSDIGRAVASLAYLMGVTRKIGAEERAQLVHAHVQFIVWAHPYLGVRKLSRAPVIAAIHKTWFKNEPAAADFWTRVKEEDHPEVDHPSRVLATFLRDSIVSDRQSKAAMRFSPDSFYIKCIHAWNAYRGGHRTALRVHDGSSFPEPM